MNALCYMAKVKVADGIKVSNQMSLKIKEAVLHYVHEPNIFTLKDEQGERKITVKVICYETNLPLLALKMEEGDLEPRNVGSL